MRKKFIRLVLLIFITAFSINLELISLQKESIIDEKESILMVKCFPIKLKNDSDKNRYSYTDSFMAERTYGGDRKHMGIDIMDNENEKGYFPIVSMSDGVVENIGWLELGGYRIGIRSKNGVYFYYAHLDSYAKGLKKNVKVKAGDLLGYMGNTGYGVEGTQDMFDVHLHIGIALKINEREEIWINPYLLLQMHDY